MVNLKGHSPTDNGKTRRFGYSPARWSYRNRITLEGGLFVALILLIGLAAVNTGHNLLYLLVAVMLATLMVSGFLGRSNLNGLSVRRLYPREFHADHPVDGQLLIDSDRLLFNSYALRVDDVIVGPVDSRAHAQQTRTLHSHALLVRHRNVALCPTRIRLPHRGRYRLPGVRLSSRFPFGFFERIRQLNLPGEVLVYPRIYSTSRMLPYVSRELGDQIGQRRGQGSSLYGLRQYQPDDPARHIHWKKSVRSDILMLKEFEEERSQSFLLMLELRCDSKDKQAVESFERAVCVAASLADYLLKQDALVGLWTTVGNIHPAVGEEQRRRIMRALAEIQPQDWDAPVRPPAGAQMALTEIWIDFHPADSRGAREGTVIRRSPGAHTIDVRKIEFDAIEIP